MKLEDIRKQIEELVQFAPAAERHRNALNNAINRCLGQLVVSQNWTYRQRTYAFAAFPDAVWDYAGWTISQGGLPVRRITVTDFSVVGASNEIIRRRTAQWLAAALNNPVETPATLLRDDGLIEAGYGSEVFLVERATATLGASDKFPSGIELYLDPRFGLLTTPKDPAWVGDWTLRFLHYALPRDCAQVERVVITHSDGGVNRQLLDAWDPGRENIGGDLDPADTGAPNRWAVQVVGVGATPGAAISGAGSVGYPHQVNDGGAHMVTPEAPTTLALTVVALGGGWLAPSVGKRLQFCTTWAYAGMESGPSPVVEQVLALATDTIRLTLETFTEAEFGRLQYVYMRVNEGQWRRVATGISSADGSIDILGPAGAAPELLQAQDPTKQAQGLREAATQQWLRLHPRPTTITDVEVRYLAAARKLIADEDVPEIPEQFHAMLVYHVVADVGARHGASEKFVDFYREQYTEQLGVMVRRHLLTADAPRVRRSSWAGNGWGPRWDGSITYNSDT